MLRIGGADTEYGCGMEFWTCITPLSGAIRVETHFSSTHHICPSGGWWGELRRGPRHHIWNQHPQPSTIFFYCFDFCGLGKSTWCNYIPYPIDLFIQSFVYDVLPIPLCVLSNSIVNIVRLNFMTNSIKRIRNEIRPNRQRQSSLIERMRPNQFDK